MLEKSLRNGDTAIKYLAGNNDSVNLKENLKQLNDGFKDKLRAATLATGMGLSALTGGHAQASNQQDTDAPPTHQEVQHSSIESYMPELKKFIQGNEGRKEFVYKDSRGNPTVGVGFNLNRSDAHKVCEALGVDYKALKTGQVGLDQEQIDRVLNHDIKNAIEVARELVENFDEQPIKVQVAVVDMAFNMGEGQLELFDRFLTAVEKKDYNKAIHSMKHSLWYKQVGTRAVKDINLVAGAMKKQLTEEEIQKL